MVVEEQIEGGNSYLKNSQFSGYIQHAYEADIPCHRTLYKKSTTTSFSAMPMLLKCFRHAFAN